MTSFFMQGAWPLVKDAPNVRLHQRIDWADFRASLVGLYQRAIRGAGGPEPYDPLSMFKLMLLGQWHELSDTQLEHSLKMRLDFMVFTGFEPGSLRAFPDASTICRFRNRLVKAKLDQALLSKINEHLARAGLKVKGTRATKAKSPERPGSGRRETP